jgi:hypothetical protein
VGLTNPDNAKFCANCGTRFANLSDPHQTLYQPQSPQEWPRTAPGKNSVMKNVGLGLVVLLIFLFFGLSCTRACFRHRRYYRHYGAVMCPAAPRDTSLTLCAPIAKPFPIAGNSSVFRENIATPHGLSPVIMTERIPMARSWAMRSFMREITPSRNCPAKRRADSFVRPDQRVHLHRLSG